MINKRKIVRPRTLRGSGQQINKIKMKSTLMPNERERDKDSDFFFFKNSIDVGPRCINASTLPPCHDIPRRVVSLGRLGSSWGW